MPTTYEPIATTTVGTATNAIDFTNIPQTYTDIIVVATLKRTTSGSDVFCRVGNSTYDTGTNYSDTILYGDGTSAGSYRESNANRFLLDYYGGVDTTNDHIGIYHFMNYSNTTTNKTVLSRSNRASSGVDAIVAMWRSTSAINQMRFVLDSAFSASNVIAIGSSITLYGIKAA